MITEINSKGVETKNAEKSEKNLTKNQTPCFPKDKLKNKQQEPLTLNKQLPKNHLNFQPRNFEESIENI